MGDFEVKAALPVLPAATARTWLWCQDHAILQLNPKKQTVCSHTYARKYANRRSVSTKPDPVCRA